MRDSRPGRGQISVEHRGTFVHLSICLFVLWWPEGSLWTDLRPEEADWTNLKPERTEISPEWACFSLKPKRPD